MWSGIIEEAKLIACPSCRTDNKLSIYYYIDGSAWPEYFEYLTDDSNESHYCSACNESINIRSPLILDLPDRNLLIFSTPRGDDEGLDAGFKQFFNKMLPHLPPDVAEAATKRPYTFVDGRRGLKALLTYFSGRPFEMDSIDEEALSGRIFITTLQGYIYGDLFFYFPGQFPVQELVGMVISAALDLDSNGYPEAGIELLQGVERHIGDSHPWLAHELGRVLLGQGKVAQAREWLRKSLIRQHCWHAVTASFLDATPRKREDGDTQSSELPHATPADRLGAITSTRHTVTQVSPEKDIGLWDFPRMAAASIPEDYILDNLLRGYATALGKYDHHQFRELDPSRLREATHVGWYRVQRISKELILQNEADAALYWDAYISARWDLDLTISQIDIVKAVHKASEVLADIDAHFKLLQEEPEDTPYVFFAKGFSASHIRFFLLQSAHHIRRKLLLELQNTPNGLEGELSLRLWRSESVLESEAREAFANGQGLAELIAWFRVFVPQVAKISAESLRNQKTAVSASTCTLLGRLREFALSAFEDEVTGAEIKFLKDTSRELESLLGGIADLLEFFVKRLSEEVNSNHDQGYCYYDLIQEQCPVCFQEILVFQWSTIHLMDRPDLETLVKSGKAVEPICVICGSYLHRQYPLLYCDPEKNLYLLLCPQLDEEEEKKLNTMTSEYFEQLPLEYRDNRPYVAISSKYVAGWQNDEQYVIVCRVRNIQEFGGILKSRK